MTAPSKPTFKKPGPWTGGLRGGVRILGGHSTGKRGKPSPLAEQIADANFGKSAQRLASADWQKSHASGDD